MLSRRLLLAAPVVGLTGCIETLPPVDFPLLPDADLIDAVVSGGFTREYGSYTLRNRIEDPDRCRFITAFLNARRKGFTTPFAGPPIPACALHLRREGKLLSLVGIGTYFLQRAMFETLSIPKAEIMELLALAGLDETALEHR